MVKSIELCSSPTHPLNNNKTRKRKSKQRDNSRREPSFWELLALRAQREWHYYFVALAVEFDLVNDKKTGIPLIKLVTPNYERNLK